MKRIQYMLIMGLARQNRSARVLRNVSMLVVDYETKRIQRINVWA